MALQDFERLLRHPKFEFRAQSIDARAAAHAENLSIPDAQVYLLDALGSRAIAESLLASLSKQFPSARLVVVAEEFTDTSAFSALRLGARGLLTYTEAREQLPRAVDAVAAGGFWVPRALLSRFVDHVLGHAPGPSPGSKPVNLSRREQEVFDGLLENLANKEIASRLNISERTVKFHVSNVLAKFGVRRRADLIVHFVQAKTPLA